MIMNLLQSILLSIIPKALFITLMITKIKNINNEKFLLFTLIGISIAFTISIKNYVFYLYFALIFEIFCICKILYKNEIKLYDIILICYIYFIIMLGSFISRILAINELSYYLINNLILFMRLIFTKWSKIEYNILIEIWNRQNKIISSIALRNISLILINTLIVIIALYIQNDELITKLNVITLF